MKLTPKNWASFQHYKDRSPAWIKLHKALLDDYEFQRLPVASRALAPMLWLLASEHSEGVIEASADKLAFRLRMTVDDFLEALEPLVIQCFFESDSTALAQVYRDSIPEKEEYRKEIEIEGEKNIGASAPCDVSQSTAPSKPKRTPRDALCEVLDADHAIAVIDHRRALRKPLTVRAAELLAAQLALARDGPNEAADRMISRGWQGYKPEWDNEHEQRNRNNGKPHFSGVVANLRHMLDNPEDGDRGGPEPVADHGVLQIGRRSGLA